MNFEQVKRLAKGEKVYLLNNFNADGSPMNWRVNGKVETWKTRPNDIRVPIKRGLRDYGAITQTNMAEFVLTVAEAIGQSKPPSLGINGKHRKFNRRQRISANAA